MTCSNSERMRLYNKTRALLLKIRGMHSIIIDETKEKQDEIMRILHDEVSELKTDIHANTTCLGNLAGYLLSAQIGFEYELKALLACCVGKEYKRYPNTLDSFEEIQKAEKWIKENMNGFV